MRKLVLAALTLGAALTATNAAEARDGCGPGGHRNGYGDCRPNRGPVIVERGPLVVHRYYAGRGYWDGHRYWHHRDRWHGGWRYR